MGLLQHSPDLEIPCFALTEFCAPVSIEVQKRVDSRSWLRQDWNTDGDPNLDPQVLAVGFAPLEERISFLIVDELQIPQANDAACFQAQEYIAHGRPSQYVEDERGLIVGLASVDGRYKYYALSTSDKRFSSWGITRHSPATPGLRSSITLKGEPFTGRKC